jgi:ABC-type multidrug transport system ATPase subunit
LDKGLIGYLPDVPEYYEYLTPTEFLALYGKIAGLNKKEALERNINLRCDPFEADFLWQVHATI